MLLPYILMRLRKLNNEKGATAVEYGLMVALIALAIIFAVTALGTNLAALFTSISDTIKGL